jgi:hypothetical protein
VLAGSIYSKLDGKKIVEPEAANARPSPASLTAHFALFQA